jgi:hypothetical protein
MFSHDPVIQALVGLAYGMLVAGLLVWSVKRGMRLTGFSFRELMTHANDELTIKYFERYAKTDSDWDEGREKETGKPGLDGAVPEGT